MSEQNIINFDEGGFNTPPKLTSKQKALCERLDSFYELHEFTFRPSDMFRGAIFVSQEKYSNNPDWLSQAANSLREILYPFFSNKDDAFNKFGSVRINEDELKDSLQRLYGQVSTIAHHGNKSSGKDNSRTKKYFSSFNRENFEELIRHFEDVLFKILDRQIDVHEAIDEFFKQDILNADTKEAFGLKSINLDAESYFFEKADHTWLVWLWDNGFLNILKESDNVDEGKYTYIPTEIFFLQEAAKNNPSGALKIILDDSIATKKENLRPELIDSILNICSSFESKYLVKLIPKIYQQEWIKHSYDNLKFWFKHKDIFKTLFEAEEYKSLLILTEAFLSIKAKKEIIKSNSDFILSSNPFYYKNITETKVFEYLQKIEEEKYTEKTLEVLLNITSKILSYGEAADEGVFKRKSIYPLLDVDFFDFDGEPKASVYRTNGFKELILSVQIITERILLAKYQNNPVKLREFFEKYIGVTGSSPLPNTSVMWRLRIYLLCLCPNEFLVDIKNELWKLFDSPKYWDFLSGTEYEKALMIAFPLFSSEEKRSYINKVMSYFTETGKSTNDSDDSWHIISASKILSVIGNDEVIQELNEEISRLGFEINEAYRPTSASYNSGGAYRVESQSPISYIEFDKLPAKKIANNLKTIWAPEKLYELNTNDVEGRRNPINMDGLSIMLKNSIHKRPEEFIENALLFFEPKKLHTYYTYAFLSGVKDYSENLKSDEYSIVINLLAEITNTGRRCELVDDKETKKNRFDTWVANWNSVHEIVADIIQGILRNINKETKADFTSLRSQILYIVEYLLSHSDPKKEEEDIGKAKHTTKHPKEENYKIVNPYSVAINSVRGRAFQALIVLIDHDWINLGRKENSKLNKDTKAIFKTFLETENTRALMFMLGRYFTTLYFTDKEFTIGGIMNSIFKNNDCYLNLAAIEGYLSNNLHKDIWEDLSMQRLYIDWIGLENTTYPNQKNYKDIDEALTTHLALAFVYFDVEIETNKVLKSFWSKENTIRQKNFISFIGRHALSHANAKNDWFEEKGIDKNKLLKFWDWANENITDREVLSAFGLWINPKIEVFGDAEVIKRISFTIEKTYTGLEWSYGLMERVESFASVNPEKTLNMIWWYLLDENSNVPSWPISDIPLAYKDELIKALRIIYEVATLKEKVTLLITILVKQGSRFYWDFKKVLDE